MLLNFIPDITLMSCCRRALVGPMSIFTCDDCGEDSDFLFLSNRFVPAIILSSLSSWMEPFGPDTTISPPGPIIPSCIDDVVDFALDINENNPAIDATASGIPIPRGIWAKVLKIAPIAEVIKGRAIVPKTAANAMQGLFHPVKVDQNFL
jgi:hypothetical protein